MTLRLSRAQVREIDRRAIAEYCIPGIVLMENASRGAADVAMEMLVANSPRVAIVCGRGNNGGDGLAVARHLHNRGVRVRIVPAWESEPSGDAQINLQIVRVIRLPMTTLDETDDDLLIDALFGTGLTRPITGAIAELIARMNESRVPILAIDVPSGLDCDTGQPLGPCVRAAKTVTFVAEKIGFANPGSREYTGEVIVKDIGVPPELIATVART